MSTNNRTAAELQYAEGDAVVIVPTGQHGIVVGIQSWVSSMDGVTVLYKYDVEAKGGLMHGGRCTVHAHDLKPLECTTSTSM